MHQSETDIVYWEVETRSYSAIDFKNTRTHPLKYLGERNIQISARNIVKLICQLLFNDFSYMYLNLRFWLKDKFHIYHSIHTCAYIYIYIYVY